MDTGTRNMMYSGFGPVVTDVQVQHANLWVKLHFAAGL
jgi:hypothetical protein